MANESGDNAMNQDSAPRNPQGPMVTAMKVVQAVIGIAGLALIGLGFAFWGGHARNFIPLHEQMGIFTVVLLWVLAAIGLAYRVSRALIVAAVVWGFIVIGFGFAQVGIMTGNLHWIIRVIHFLLGLGALVMAARIAKGISVGSMAKR
jgi:hypothetical protein